MNNGAQGWLSSRYSRQVILEQIGRWGQEILLKSRVMIVGCGALGTNVSNNLARAGVGHLTIVDRDIVELHNLQRQILFDEEDVGTAKAAAAARKLQRINSEIDIKGLVKDLNNRNIEDAIEGFDLLIDATDNFPSRLLINDACVKNTIPWIYAGVIQTKGMVMNILPDGPCLRCLVPDVPAPGLLPTCETAGILNTIPSIIAAIEVTEAVKILLKKNIDRSLIIYDVWDHQFHRIKVEKNRKCDCCIKRDFKFLNSETKEIVNTLCGNSVQIIPPENTVIDLGMIAANLGNTIDHLLVNEFILRFQAEGKNITLFKNGRAIIKGTTDLGAAKSLYSRYLGL